MKTAAFSGRVSGIGRRTVKRLLADGWNAKPMAKPVAAPSPYSAFPPSDPSLQGRIADPDDVADAIIFYLSEGGEVFQWHGAACGWLRAGCFFQDLVATVRQRVFLAASQSCATQVPRASAYKTSAPRIRPSSPVNEARWNTSRISSRVAPFCRAFRMCIARPGSNM